MGLAERIQAQRALKAVKDTISRRGRQFVAPDQSIFKGILDERVSAVEQTWGAEIYQTFNNTGRFAQLHLAGDTPTKKGDVIICQLTQTRWQVHDTRLDAHPTPIRLVALLSLAPMNR